MKTIILLLSIVGSINLFGQDNIEIKFQRNIKLNETLSADHQYVFENFWDGRILYKDKTYSKSKMNYNILLDEMHFIDEKGKIMSVANPSDIQIIKIRNINFVPSQSNGYFESILEGKVCLYFKWKCKIVDLGREGVLGITNYTNKIYQYDKFVNYADDEVNDNNALNKSKIVNVSVVIIPYLKKGTKIIRANNVKGFIKAFGHKDEIMQFVNQNSINLNLEDDLKKLTNYCNSLN